MFRTINLASVFSREDRLCTVLGNAVVHRIYCIGKIWHFVIEKHFGTLMICNVCGLSFSVTLESSQSGSNYNKYGDYKPVDIKLTSEQNREISKESVDSDTNTTRESSGRTSVIADGVDDESTGHVHDRGTPSISTNVPDTRTAFASVNSDSATLDGRSKKTEGKERDTDKSPDRRASFLDGFDAINEDPEMAEYREMYQVLYT